jgi:predicted phage terminase large subunit-like protein
MERLERWEDLAKDPVNVEAVRDMCIGSFRLFVECTFKFVFRKKFIWCDDLHGVIEQELMEVWTGLNRNAILNMPPRYGKTEMLVLFCAWAFGHNSQCEFLHLSFSDKLTSRNSLRIKEVMKSDFYRAVFPTRINPAKDAAEDWNTTDGGRFGARPTSGQVTGFGAGATSEEGDDGDYVFSGMIWIDDPLKPEDAHTVRREKVNDAWHETIKSRRNAKTTPTLVTMQRIHEGDFTAELMSDTSEEFRQVKLKALRDDGTALWPLKHSVKDLENMRETNLFVFSSQYQQEPTAKGGSLFKAEWWRYYTSLPYDIEKFIITGDTAQKIKEHNDYSVFQLWAMAQNKIYLVDQIRGKWLSPQLREVAIAFINRSKLAHPQLYAAYIEDKASGTDLIQSLPLMTNVPIIPIPRNVDKVTRAFDASPYIQSGMVLLPTGAAFTEIFTAEASSFNAEMTHLHDDQVDAMMDAVQILLGASEVSMFDVL